MTANLWKLDYGKQWFVRYSPRWHQPTADPKDYLWTRLPRKKHSVTNCPRKCTAPDYEAYPLEILMEWEAIGRHYNRSPIFDPDPWSPIIDTPLQLLLKPSDPSNNPHLLSNYPHLPKQLESVLLRPDRCLFVSLFYLLFIKYIFHIKLFVFIDMIFWLD